MIEELEKLLACIKEKNPNADLDLVSRAFHFANDAHQGQMRMSGEPYFVHPVSVALILADIGFDEHAIAAGILHDTVEDTKATIEEIDAKFGEQVADIVDGVTKISLMSFDSKEEAQAENIRKMILAMSHDIRVPLIKLADRLHNMRTLEFQKPHRKESIARETMDIYAPLANRLGLHRIKLELEDLSFKYLNHDAYSLIVDWIEKHRVVERHIIDKVTYRLEELLKTNEISGRINGRIKHKYSIHKKMTQQGLTLDEMHDILAFRVIVPELKDCYAVLGLVHSVWKPVPGRFKDYISMPKANGYQSLHTTLIGPEGDRVEIQIRSEEMHRLAEHGVASHWLYKERNSAVSLQDAPQFEWLRGIIDRQRDEADSKEFMHGLKMDLFKDEVYVFTPRGKVLELPDGATPLDFAFLIHTDIGFSCVGAKINGKLLPLSTTLKTGDTVEIITDKNRKPSHDWLKLVKTAKARNRIQHYIRTEERSAAITLGRDMLEKEGRRLSLNVNKLIKDGSLSLILRELSISSQDELFASIGYGKLTAKRVLQRLDTIINPKEKTHVHSESLTRIDHQAQTKEEQSIKKQKESIVIKGVSDMLVRYAMCCNPLPGDQIIGFISRGRGMIIHTASCPHVQEMEPERLVSVTWDNQETKPFPTRLHIITKNTKGALSKVSTVLSEQDVNIDTLMLYSRVDGSTEMEFTLEVRDTVHLYQTIDKLRQIDLVSEVIRTTGDD